MVPIPDNANDLSQWHNPVNFIVARANGDYGRTPYSFVTEISPLQFGADGSGATDSSAAFLSMVTANRYARVRLCGGNYLISPATFDAIRDLTIVDDGRLTTSTGTGPVFQSGRVTADRFVDIGFNGFSRVQYCMDFLSRHQPANSSEVTARIVGTFNWTHGVHITQNMDLGWVLLRQQSGLPITLPSGFLGINDTSDTHLATNCLMMVAGGTAPQWDLVVDANDRCGTGLYYTMGGKGRIRANRGVHRAGRLGLYLSNQASVIATQCDFNEANWGSRVTTNSVLDAPQCKFRNTRSASYGGTGNSANLDISRGSVVYVTGHETERSLFTGGLAHGIHVRRSFVSATHVDCSGVDGNGVISAAGARVAFNESWANNCGAAGIFAGGGDISVGGAAEAKGNGTYGVFTNLGGSVIGRDIDARSNTLQGVRADSGRIDISGMNARKGSSDSTTDIVVSKGGYINASGGQGGTSQTPLIQTVAGMIIK